MPRLKITLFFFILSITLSTTAQKSDGTNVNPHKELLVRWDNDAFFDIDYYYTQGAHIALIHLALRKNPLNHLLLRLKKSDKYYGLGVIQEMFTPKDILDTLLNTIDRPYAGTLFLRSSLISSSPAKRWRLTTQVDLGVLGPLSGAEQAQKLVHHLTHSKPPEGWDFQIHNRPYLNYNAKLDKGLIALPRKFDMSASSRVRLGNIHDDIQLGGRLLYGRFNNPFEACNLTSPKYIKNRDSQFFVFGGANVTFVLYNATLMGGIVPPKSDHEFSLSQIENFVGELYGGVQYTLKNFGLRAKVIWKTREFEQGDDHSWGSISFFFRL